MKRMMLTVLVLGGCLVARALADPPAAEPSPDEAAIRKMVSDYAEAFNKHDAGALAGFWSPEAVYLNRVSGDSCRPRVPSPSSLPNSSYKLDVKMTCQTESIQFVSPNVAVERGTSTMIFPKGKPDDTAYSAVYVKHEGKWLLDRVTDDANPDKESHYEQLKPLEWMIGHWVDKDDHVDVETDCNWTKNRTYLTRTFTVTVDGEAASLRVANRGRLGSGGESHPLVDVRFRRQLRGSHLDPQERSLVHPQRGPNGRRPQGVDDQCDQADRRQLVHLANYSSAPRGASCCRISRKCLSCGNSSDGAFRNGCRKTLPI